MIPNQPFKPPNDRTFWIEVGLAVLGIAIGLPGLLMYLDNREDNRRDNAEIAVWSNRMVQAEVKSSNIIAATERWRLLASNEIVNFNNIARDRERYAMAVIQYVKEFATNDHVYELGVGLGSSWVMDTNHIHPKSFTTHVTPTNVVLRKLRTP